MEAIQLPETQPKTISRVEPEDRPRDFNEWVDRLWAKIEKRKYQ